MQTGIGKWLHEQNGFGAFELTRITAIFWVFAAAGVVTAAIFVPRQHAVGECRLKPRLPASDTA